MSSISFDINDFRAGVIGSKVIGSGTVNIPFEGFLAMDDVMINGSSITKRPPLRYLSRIVDNVPKRRQFLAYGDNIFYAIGATQAFTIRDGKNIEVLPDIYKVVSYEERNEYDIVTFDKAIDLTKGAYVVGYINSYATDVYVVSLVPGTTTSYIFDSFTQQKSNRLIWLTHVQQAKVVNVSVADYVDYAAGVYVTGSKTDGFNIDFNGVITANAIRADSITPYGVKSATGTSADPATANSTINVSLSGNPSFALAAEFGKVLYWIRAIYRGLVVSTDAGVFYMRITGAEAELSVIDNKTTSNVKPVFFKNYVIYADSAGESLSYIKVEPFSSVAFSADLTSDNDLFVGHGGVNKLLVYYNNNMPYVIVIMNDGACVVGQITENQKNYEISISLMRWFVGYTINDAVVYKQGSLENVLVLSTTYLGFTSILTMSYVSPPLFSDDSIRAPFVDMYREIKTKEIFPEQVNIDFFGEDYRDSTYTATTSVDYFTDMFVNAIIKADVSFRVLRVVDKKTAICEVVGKTFMGGYFLAKAGTYDIQINQYSGINHLFAFLVKNRSLDFYARVDNTDSFCDIADDGSVMSFDYGSIIVVGIKYGMYLHTSPILPAGQSSFSRAGIYGNAEITVHTIGSSTAEVFVGFQQEYNPDMEFYKPTAFRESGFFRAARVSGVDIVGSSVCFSLFSDSVSQVFISCVSVSLYHGKN